MTNPKVEIEVVRSVVIGAPDRLEVRCTHCANDFQAVGMLIEALKLKYVQMVQSINQPPGPMPIPINLKQS